MTNEQKEKIKQMRQQGIGYKQIANSLYSIEPRGR